MRKLFTRSGVIALAFYIALSGLFVTLLPVITGGHDFFRTTFFTACSYFLPTVHLSFFDTSYTVWTTNHSGVGISLYTLVYYLLMLIGAVLFVLRGAREGRLLAFCFAVLLFNSAISIVSRLTYTLFNFSQAMDRGGVWFLLAFVSMAAWGALAIGVICFLLKDRSLQVNTYQTNDVVTESFYPASRSQRLANWLTDWVVILLVFSPIVFYWGFLLRDTEELDNRAFLYIPFTIAILVYFPLFETLFGVTPGKLLTGTRVTNDFGEQPPFKTIFVRSLSRLVPFEPLSIFGGNAWHDGWSQTFVLREKNNGWKTGFYLLVLPLAGLLAWGSYSGFEWMEEHNEYLSRKKRFEAEQSALAARWQHVAPGDCIRLKQIGKYSSDKVYLRVEAVTKDSVLFSRLVLSGSYDQSELAQLAAYTGEDPEAEKQALPKTAIDRLLALDFDDTEERKGVAIFNTKDLFQFDEMMNPNQPEIRNDRGGSLQTTGEKTDLSLNLENIGQGAEIIEVRPLGGEAKWTFYNPTIEAATRWPARFSINASGHKSGTTYKAELRLRDEGGREQRYVIEGEGLEKTVQRVY